MGEERQEVHQVRPPAPRGEGEDDAPQRGDGRANPGGASSTTELKFNSIERDSLLDSYRALERQLREVEEERDVLLAAINCLEKIDPTGKMMPFLASRKARTRLSVRLMWLHNISRQRLANTVLKREWLPNSLSEEPEFWRTVYVIHWNAEAHHQGWQDQLIDSDT